MFNEVDAEALADEGESPGGPEVAFDDLYFVVLANELNVKGA